MGFFLHGFITITIIFIMIFVITICHMSNRIGNFLTKSFGSRESWDIRELAIPTLLFPPAIIFSLLIGFVFAGNLLYLFLYYIVMGFVILFLIGSVFVFRYLVKLIDGEQLHE